MNTLKEGSRARIISEVGTIGSVISLFDKRSHLIMVEIEQSKYYNVGWKILFFPRELEIIMSNINSSFLYQYCSKCDVLTLNKPALCCDHK